MIHSKIKWLISYKLGLYSEVLFQHHNFETSILKVFFKKSFREWCLCSILIAVFQNQIPSSEKCFNAWKHCTILQNIKYDNRYCESSKKNIIWSVSEIYFNTWMNIYVILFVYYIDYKYIHVCHLKHTYKETQIYTYQVSN